MQIIINKNAFIEKFAILFLALNFACAQAQHKEAPELQLSDKKVSKSVKNLYQKLEASSKKGFAIGHQDATSYGLGWLYEQNPTTIKSDVHEVCGDYPAVYGFDIGHLELGNDRNLDSVPFKLMKDLILDAHKKGGIITISWHLDNPSSGGNSWDKTSAVQDIIKGGKHRDTYELWVSRVADFMKSLKTETEMVPVIFRPFHEMNGSWFWWGEGNCSAEDYKTLWIETLELLRDKHEVHNLLYVYSPNKLNPTDDYLKYYPGDNYVDILGIDIYDFKNSEDYIKSVVNDLKIVKDIASQKGKLYAFTETGLETLSTPNWFTQILYPVIENTGIAWVLFWRNARTDHHYMPYKGHPSENDFKTFKALPKTLFLQDIKN
ncbi:glycoside hydrolase family 26 protein [Mangrovimonas sp. TPBH4]|uniref:glycoside hydrolase family 26 protein n=1 Tax=Mangrovimonas sp. TPBH4 TaxID=1645914 RepID=UPI0006B68620|nr:glycosyl hydrolase [Mangrovimonas sp. TPBH4]